MNGQETFSDVKPFGQTETLVTITPDRPVTITPDAGGSVQANQKSAPYPATLILVPRPEFSIKASLVHNRLYSLMGLAFLMAGLFSLGWFVRSVLRTKWGHAQ